MTSNILGRLVATIAVGCAAYASVYLASGTVKAIEYIDRTDYALVELSHYIAGAQASIRGHVTEADSREEAIAEFNAAIDRRLAQLRSLNALSAAQRPAAAWMPPLQGDADVERIDQDRREYVKAATTTLTTPVFDPARSLRMFDLQAQRLMQTVATVRDNAARARAQALEGNQTTAEVSAGLGALVIAYLIWLPVFGRGRPPSGEIS